MWLAKLPSEEDKRVKTVKVCQVLLSHRQSRAGRSCVKNWLLLCLELVTHCLLYPLSMDDVVTKHYLFPFSTVVPVRLETLESPRVQRESPVDPVTVESWGSSAVCRLLLSPPPPGGLGKAAVCGGQAVAGEPAQSAGGLLPSAGEVAAC